MGAVELQSDHDQHIYLKYWITWGTRMNFHLKSLDRDENKSSQIIMSHLRLPRRRQHECELCTKCNRGWGFAVPKRKKNEKGKEGRNVHTPSFEHPCLHPLAWMLLLIFMGPIIVSPCLWVTHSMMLWPIQAKPHFAKDSLKQAKVNYIHPSSTFIFMTTFYWKFSLWIIVFKNCS